MFDNVIIGVLIIFIVRVFSITLATMRVLMMGRANRFLVAFLAFIEALTFALTFGVVANDLTNIPYLIAYCGGFAAGTWVGTEVEQRLGRGYAIIHIISMNNSLLIAKRIREAGYGATRTSGEGTTGTVGLVYVVAQRKAVNEIAKIATTIDPKAFITIEEARSVTRGFLGFGRS